MMARFAHPSQKVLAEWLDGRAVPGVDDHVGACDRCAGTLERLAGRLPDIRAVLLAVLAPPAGYQERLAIALEARSRGRAESELLAGMLTLPWQTSRPLLSADAEELRE